MKIRLLIRPHKGYNGKQNYIDAVEIFACNKERILDQVPYGIVHVDMFHAEDEVYDKLTKGEEVMFELTEVHFELGKKCSCSKDG